MFTFIQLIYMILMWIVKSTKSIAILFPVMVSQNKSIFKKTFQMKFTRAQFYSANLYILMWIVKSTIAILFPVMMRVNKPPLKNSPYRIHTCT